MANDLQRGNDISVSRLPRILVDAKPGENGCPASFHLRTKRPTLIREFTDTDSNRVLRDLKGKDRARFYSLIELIKALQSDDRLALDHAIERIKDSSQLTGKFSENRMYGSGKSSWVSLIMLRQIQDNKGQAEEQNAQRHLSRRLSEELGNVKLVLWWTGELFTPGLYSPDEGSALYVRALLGLGSATKTFMVCPHCGTLFIQERTDQQYCTVAHREAHRVSRWRAQKKIARMGKKESVNRG
jgi:uncharacterized C2H2 Zn-finger protein